MASSVRLRYEGPHDLVDLSALGLGEPVKRGAEFTTAPETAESLLEQTYTDPASGEPRASFTEAKAAATKDTEG